jgi:hypothetical protein
MLASSVSDVENFSREWRDSAQCACDKLWEFGCAQGRIVRVTNSYTRKMRQKSTRDVVRGSLWTTVSGFESLPPSQPPLTLRVSYG